MAATEAAASGTMKRLLKFVPIIGWLTLSAAGKVVPFFGFELPPLVGESKSAADWAKAAPGIIRPAQARVVIN